MSKIQINGATLKLIRDLKGIPAGKFAIQCGFTPSYLSHIESGKKQPTPEVMHIIARELRVDVWEITYTVPELVAA